MLEIPASREDKEAGPQPLLSRYPFLSFLLRVSGPGSDFFLEGGKKEGSLGKFIFHWPLLLIDNTEPCCISQVTWKHVSSPCDLV